MGKKGGLTKKRRNEEPPEEGLNFRGMADVANGVYEGPLGLHYCEDKEVLLCGPAGTGKSVAALAKLHWACEWVPGIRCLIVRKTRESLTESGLVTFESKVAGRGHSAVVSGGQRRLRQAYVYPNGSEIIVGGMDKPSKILSTEFDCLVGETLVDSPSEIQRGYGRPYSGQLVTITTAAGNQLTGTPNHPVFTDKGWVALGSLCEGDYVISRVRREEVAVGLAAPDVADQPAPIADVARTLAGASLLRPERVVTVPMDFHGDGTHGYVDVVTAARPLGAAGVSPLRQHAQQFHGERGHLQHQPLASAGPRREGFLTGLPATVSLAGTPSELREPRPVRLGVDPPCPLAPSSLGEASLPFRVRVPNVPEGLPLGRGPVAEPPGGHLLLKTPRADANQFGSFAEPEFPFEVAPDRVVQVVFADAAPGRHVYNLQTADNWYVANEIISHNCIYAQEATELREEDWETLSMRLRNGVLAYQQLMGDCNPGAPTHWLKKRCEGAAPRCRLIDSNHKHNPLYYNEDTGRLTAEGQAYIDRLKNSLSGALLERYLYGRWAQAEGVIYPTWDARYHAVPGGRIPGGGRNEDTGEWYCPPDWTRYWAIDFGHQDPFVCLMAAVDDEGRVWVYRELYQSRMLVEDHAARLLLLWRREAEWWARQRRLPKDLLMKQIMPRRIICDHDSEGRATLERHLGLGTSAARKYIQMGVQLLSERLRLLDEHTSGGQLPPLVCIETMTDQVDRALVELKHPTTLLEEMACYVWDAKKDKPVDKYNHACDALRYLILDLSVGISGLWEAAEDVPWTEEPRDRAIAPRPSLLYGVSSRDRSAGRRLFGRS